MNCKNCEKIIEDKFCKSCGQKSNTTRLTFKNFISQDILNGLFHLNSGLLFTLKSIFLKPGKVANEYIEGKRKKYYNFFYLLLLIIGINLLLKKYEILPHKLVDDSNGKEFDLSLFLIQNLKLVIFSYIPIFSISAFIVFRKLKLNFIEFVIPSVVAVIGSSLFSTLWSISKIIHFAIYNTEKSSGIFFPINTFLFLSMMLFPVFVFYLFIKNKYSTGGVFWRLLVFYIISILFLLIILLLITYATGKKTIAFQYWI